MYRTLTRQLLGSAFLILGVGFAHRTDAEMPPDAYAPVVVQTRVADRQGHPVTNLSVRLTVDLNGVALEDDGRSEGIQTSATRTVRTDTSGLATVNLSGLPWTHETHWYRGQVHWTASLPRDPQREISPLGAEAVSETRELPAGSRGCVRDARTARKRAASATGSANSHTANLRRGRQNDCWLPSLVRAYWVIG